MVQFHEELIVEILLRLPVKSLLRFKCLSKPLRSVIETPNFINLHNLMSCSSQKRNQRKLICSSSDEFEVHDVNYVDSEEENILRLEKQVTVSFSRSSDVSGYCKGLLLLSQSCGFGLTLWNPSTRKSRDLPDCPLEGAHDHHSNRIIGLGLGYDDSINDYKVCCIVYVKPTPESEVQIQVWIYALKSNTWRKMTLDFPNPDYTMEEGHCCFRTPGIGYFADASLYWLIRNSQWKKKIVAFDMKHEMFALVPPPDVFAFNSKDEVSTTLHVLEGCLCISYIMSESTRAYLHMMKKSTDGSVDKFTWKKLFLVKKRKPILPMNYNKDSFGNMRVLGYSKSGGKILLHFGKDRMLWYDLKMKTFGEVETNMNNERYDHILCVESLASVGAW